MNDLELHGLNARQQVLADIMWSLEEFDQVQAFIKTLPRREKIECEGIIEMMKMAIVEQCRTGVENTKEADKIIKQIRSKKD
jgi:hypothetical protein